jgi:hypothetical protein
MLKRITRESLAPCIVLFVAGSVVGCHKRADDCNWNENCESVTASGGNGGNSGSAGTAGTSETNGGASGSSSSTGGSGGSDGGAGGAGGDSTTTTVPTVCSGTPDNPCSITTEYGVFVSPSGNDDTGAGSATNPYATLSKALAVAAVPKNKLKRNVYVCSSAGDFALSETLVIGTEFDGINVYGGFDCSNATTWTYESTPESRAKFVSAAPLAVKLDGLDGTVRFENLSFKAENASTPGDSSIAMLVVNSPRVTLSNVELIAQNGAKGSNGAAATTPAQDGTSGNPGTEACSIKAATTDAVVIAGATAVVTDCDGNVVSTGARGGTGAVGESAVGGAGELGSPAPAPNETFFGYGGDGEKGSSSPSTNGHDGADGSDGPSIDPVNGPGLLGSDGYTPKNGLNGATGKPGQGGGGGGGAQAPSSCSSDHPIIVTGASGGSGGSGGCGGKGGQGGQGGGASFALAAVNSPLTLVACTLTSGNGGKGGAGAAGQGGGLGGSGGNSGKGYGTGHASRPGGKGGNGGNGSAGGGGAGGDSAAIGYVGGAPTVDTNSVLTVPTSGATGGVDGNGASIVAGGQGKAQKLLELKS